MKYKFKAKDIKTGEWVEGDLAYVKQRFYGKPSKERPMIVELNYHGGLIWANDRHFIDESTLIAEIQQ